MSLLTRWRQERDAQQRADAVAYLHDRVRFRSLLECERMRSDRSHTKFSLAVFAFAENDDGRARLAAFARHLETRIRATDHPGFVDPFRIGVILWDTGEVGAWKFIDAIQGAEGAPAVDRCDVFIYPTHEAPKQESNGPRERGQFVPQTVGLLDAVSREVSSPRPVQPLEAMFIQPLPRWKRTIDVIGATAGLVLLSPLLTATAFAIRLTSKGPALFAQPRAGLGGQPFTIYKFRTMAVDAEAQKETLKAQSEQDGPAFKMKHDPRVTRLGRILRKSCIDELPQLWNVLKGDMTLVGPRPLVLKETAQIDGWKRRRLEVTPGLTCIWQVHGKSKVPFTEWMRMDIRYLKARTFWRDLRLIFETLLAVVMHRASH